MQDTRYKTVLSPTLNHIQSYSPLTANRFEKNACADMLFPCC